MVQSAKKSEKGASVGRRTGAQAIGALVPDLTRTAFESFGFPAAQLVTHWSAIVGADLAAHTAPERLRWPSGQESGFDGGQRRGAAGGQPVAHHARGYQGRPQRDHEGAVLVLRVDGARALDVQFQAPQLIERINAFFGYRAVTDLRILQAPLGEVRLGDAHGGAGGGDMRQPVRARSRDTKVLGEAEAVLADIPDQGLRSALERLGRSIGGAKPSGS